MKSAMTAARRRLSVFIDVHPVITFLPQIDPEPPSYHRCRRRPAASSFCCCSQLSAAATVSKQTLARIMDAGAAQLVEFVMLGPRVFMKG